MDTVQKPSNPECYTWSSDPCKIYVECFISTAPIASHSQVLNIEFVILKYITYFFHLAMLVITDHHQELFVVDMFLFSLQIWCYINCKKFCMKWEDD
jgi:hypothetical protein